MRRSVPLLALVAALACAPAAGSREGQTLALGSAATKLEVCVDGALAASDLVDRNAPSRQWSPRREGLRQRGVRLMNPPGPRIQSVMFAVESSHGEPHQFTVEYFQPGPSGLQAAADPRVAELEGQAVAEISARLLREVRAICIPAAAKEPTCSMVGQGRVGRCTIAA